MTKNEIVSADGEVLPVLTDDMLTDDVLGYSEKSEDSLVPVLAILQDNSGEVKKKHDRYVEGAEAGMFIIRAMQMIFAEGEELVFQPCGFSHDWVEWQGEPGEGSPVGSFPFEERPEDAEEVTDSEGRKKWMRSTTGNRLVETRHHFGNVLTADGPVPVVIAMSGSNHGVSRGWTTLMKKYRVPGNPAKKAPSFMRTYLLSTAFVQRGAQSWYKFKVKDNGWVTDRSILENGFAFAKAVASKEVRAGVDAESVAEQDSDSDDIPV